MLSIVSEHISDTITAGNSSGGPYAAMVTDGDDLCSAKALVGKFSPPMLRCDTIIPGTPDSPFRTDARIIPMRSASTRTPGIPHGRIDE
jgi:hypothetical protein